MTTARATRMRGGARLLEVAHLVLRWGPVPLALAGMGISAYLTIVHFGDAPLYCEGSGGCHTVQSSEYATVAGVPVSLLGLILYATFLAVSLVALLGTGDLAELAPFAAFGLSLAGALYSAYLTWLEVYRIHAICMWCVVSASLLFVIFLASAGDLLLSGRWRDFEDAG